MIIDITASSFYMQYIPTRYTLSDKSDRFTSRITFLKCLLIKYKVYFYLLGLINVLYIHDATLLPD
jgi:hypothetical protein